MTMALNADAQWLKDETSPQRLGQRLKSYLIAALDHQGNIARQYNVRNYLQSVCTPAYNCTETSKYISKIVLPYCSLASLLLPVDFAPQVPCLESLLAW